MGFTLDARGKPIYNDTSDPMPDLQGAADWADKVGAGFRGTASERGLLSSDEIDVGQFFTETDTGFIYKRKASGWDVVWRDTGWVEVDTFYAGWTEIEQVAWRVITNTLHIVGRVNGDGASGPGIFNIPSPYRHTRASNIFFSEGARTLGLTPAGDVLCAVPNTGVRGGVILGGIATLIG